MAVKEWTIVGLGEESTSKGLLPRDVVRFLDYYDMGAANIAAGQSLSDDAKLVTIENKMVVSRKRPRRPQIMLGFSHLPWKKLLQLRRMESEQRPVYFCPNVEENTTFLMPMLGSYRPMIGRGGTLSLTGAGTYGWVWDDDRQTFFPQTGWITSDDNASPVGFGGPYGVYSRPSLKAFSNKATNPIPASGATGWSVVTGAGTVGYDEQTRLPVVTNERRGNDTATDEGVTTLMSDGATGSQTQWAHSATGLSSTVQIVATVLIKAHDSFVVSLHNAAGTQEDSQSVNAATGWTLVRLQGEQSVGGTTANVTITHINGDERRVSCKVGTVFISNTAETMTAGEGWRFPDFVEADQDALTFNKNIGPTLAGGYTVSMAIRHLSGNYGSLILGSGSDALVVRRPEVNDFVFITVGSDSTNTSGRTFTDAGIGPGDFYMLTIVNNASGFHAYINGRLANTWGTSDPPDCGVISDLKRVGYSSNTEEWMEEGGMMMLRIDEEPWSAERVERHYNTYLAPGGVAYVAPTFGWRFHIASLDHEPFNLRDDRLVVSGQIVLEGMDSDPHARAMHTDYGSIV